MKCKLSDRKLPLSFLKVPFHCDKRPNFDKRRFLKHCHIATNKMIILLNTFTTLSLLNLFFGCCIIELTHQLHARIYNNVLVKQENKALSKPWLNDVCNIFYAMLCCGSLIVILCVIYCVHEYTRYIQSLHGQILM